MSQSLPFCSTEPSVANSIKTQPYLQDCSTSVHLYGVKGRDRRCHRGGTRRTAAHAAARVSLCPTFQHHCWHSSVHTWRENRQKCWLREDQGDADEVHFKQNKYCPQHHLIFGHPSSGCSVALVLLEVPLNGSMKTLICIWNRIWSCVSPDTDPPLVRKAFLPLHELYSHCSIHGTCCVWGFWTQHLLGQQQKSPLEPQEASIIFTPQMIPEFHSNWQFPPPSLRTVQAHPLSCGNSREWGHHFLGRNGNCSGATQSWEFTPATKAMFQ